MLVVCGGRNALRSSWNKTKQATLKLVRILLQTRICRVRVRERPLLDGLETGFTGNTVPRDLDGESGRGVKIKGLLTDLSCIG